MGFATGLSSKSGDKLAGAAAAPRRLFPQAVGSAGWVHPQPKPETGGLGAEKNPPIFDG